MTHKFRLIWRKDGRKKAKSVDFFPLKKINVLFERTQNLYDKTTQKHRFNFKTPKINEF